MSWSEIKVMLVVSFDWKGIVHHEFVSRSQMAINRFYQEVLAHLRDAVFRKRPELLENQTWMLDVAPPAHESFPIHIHPILRS